MNCRQQLLDYGITAILRGITPAQVSRTVEALLAGGIQSVEITLNTPGALKMIEQVKELYGSRMLVGAGTVLDKQAAAQAVMAGADFILSPVLDVQVIELCHAYSRASVPGVMSPTEIYTAQSAGADILKLFPAGALGPDYVRLIQGPLNGLALMGVGGITIQNIRSFHAAGVSCFGIGSELVNQTLLGKEDSKEITRRARLLREEWNRTPTL